MVEKQSPIRPTDDQARDLGKSLIYRAGFASLAVIDIETSFPLVTRTLTVSDQDGTPVILISDLSNHTKALKADARCSLLFGEPGKGDPLAHPRITVLAEAQQIPRTDPDHLGLRQLFLDAHPKSQLYIDFADFSFYRMEIKSAYLNGGFGKAFILTASDLLESSGLHKK